MATRKRSCTLHRQARIVQLDLQIVFTAVLAKPPSELDSLEARRVRFERLSLPLGSNFLIIAPPERSRERGLKGENSNHCRKYKHNTDSCQQREYRTDIVASKGIK